MFCCSWCGRRSKVTWTDKHDGTQCVKDRVCVCGGEGCSVPVMLQCYVTSSIIFTVKETHYESQTKDVWKPSSSWNVASHPALNIRHSLKFNLQTKQKCMKTMCNSIMREPTHTHTHTHHFPQFYCMALHYNWGFICNLIIHKYQILVACNLLACFSSIN